MGVFLRVVGNGRMLSPRPAAAFALDQSLLIWPMPFARPVASGSRRLRLKVLDGPAALGFRHCTKGLGEI